MTISIAYLLMQMPAPSEVFLAVEVNALIRAGVDVKVFCLRPRHPQHEKLLADQQIAAVPIYFFSWFGLRNLLYWVRRSPGILLHMVALIIRTCWRRPDILIRSLAVLPKSFSIARQIEKDDLKIVHAAWGHYPAITAYLVRRLMPSVQFTLALGAYDRLMRHPMTTVAAGRAACIVTQSEAGRELIRTEWPRYDGPIHVVARGIDLERVSPVDEQLSRTPGLIVSVGRLIEAKGHQDLILAFAKVRGQLPESRLMIIGEGVYRSTLEQLAASLGLSDAVELPGHLNQSQLFRRISNASAFVLASRSENLPNSMKEAMAIGIPVISTATTGLTELVQDGVSGCIVPVGDVDAIAAALVRVLSDDEFANRLARQASYNVQQGFDLRKTTALRTRLYSTLAYESGEACIAQYECITPTI